MASPEITPSIGTIASGPVPAAPRLYTQQAQKLFREVKQLDLDDLLRLINSQLYRICNPVLLFLEFAIPLRQVHCLPVRGCRFHRNPFPPRHGDFDSHDAPRPRDIAFLFSPIGSLGWSIAEPQAAIMSCLQHALVLLHRGISNPWPFVFNSGPLRWMGKPESLSITPF